MQTLSRPIIVMAVVLSIAAATFGAVAQEIPTAQVAVLDYQKILRDSSSAVDIKAQVERQRQIYQDQITKQEQELRDADQELARQRTILAPEAFAQKRREFEERVAEVQREVQSRKRELDQAYDYGIQQVQQALVGIITELAEERGFNLILSRQQIVYADKSLNISEEVLVRLNERLPKVTVPLAQE
ncbi:MAG: OmpH family outer membrane protein [Gammaproteobacteria bacterium]|nr:OmpH family outer membrane protein [Gammaproteobacteria bacterium]